MQPLARQSARSIIRRRPRTFRDRSQQGAVCVQQKGFHASTTLYQPPKSPQEPPKTDERSEENKRSHARSQDHAKKDKHIKEVNGEEVSEQSEVGNSFTRGTFRSRRSREVEVPKPPPIPQWFLKHNVQLRVGKVSAARPDRVRRYIVRRTGLTLFTLPYCDRETVQTLQMSIKDSSKEQPKQSKVGNEANQASVDGAPESLAPNFFTPKVQETPPSSTDKPIPERPSKNVKHGVDHVYSTILENFNPYDINPFVWILLETELAIQAAFSMSSLAQPFLRSATRVDISLRCPHAEKHFEMDGYVESMAAIVGADLIRLDANDIAELTGEYVGGSNDSPGSFSNLAHEVYDGYKATHEVRILHRVGECESEEKNDEIEEEGDEEEDEKGAQPFSESFSDMELGHYAQKLSRLLESKGFASMNSVINSVLPDGFKPVFDERAVKYKEDEYVHWDGARLSACLDDLLDAPAVKRQADAIGNPPNDFGLPLPGPDAGDQENAQNRYRASETLWRGVASRCLAALLSGGATPKRLNCSVLPLQYADEAAGQTADAKPTEEERRTIVHVRDLHGVQQRSRLGDTIIQRLVRLVQKRRRAGEKILIVGTSAEALFDGFSTWGKTDGNDSFRSLTVPPLFALSEEDESAFRKAHSTWTKGKITAPAYERVLQINLRHIQDLLRRLNVVSPDRDFFTPEAREQLLPHTYILGDRTLSQDEVQTIVLTAIGLWRTHAQADEITPLHIAVAVSLISKSNHIVTTWNQLENGKANRKLANLGKINKRSDDAPSGRSKVDRVREDCNSYEKKLLSSVKDPQSIKTTFSNVHAPPETIEALRTLTTLSLLRPDAFKYGVLAADRLPGLLLYGPPGTGKTMLAKAVAKESAATVLEVSGAQIYEKYVGEGEKMVRAVFSLAKKLSPCVVFIDEADALFGSRGQAGNRNTHREIINQFLREWDGMDDHSVFIMVATNRPFDLDDAVLRRLPRRLLVDLPVAKDRESILGIHLKDEQLESSVSLDALAEQTPLYSGSDLKNLCVAAALACVREENELLTENIGKDGFKLPDKRVLTASHFDKAISEISASISEDMSTLRAIRKFDEQYGDRRGRKKKTGYGFGGMETIVDENAARVRQDFAHP